MAVKRHLISTQKQAFDYAMGSAKSAAAGVCPSTAAEYQTLAAKVTAGYFGTDADPSSVFVATAFDKQAFLAALGQVDGRCRMSADYNPPTSSGGTSSPQIVDLTTGGAAPINGGVVKAGFPWWIVLLLGGGALVYYLSTKKSGSSLSRGEHLVRKVKSKRSKARSRRKR